jgi:hypothetical protein
VCVRVRVRVRACTSVFKSVRVHAYIDTGTDTCILLLIWHIDTGTDMLGTDMLGIDFLAGFVGEKGVEWNAACACCVLYVYCIWSGGGLRSWPVGMKSFFSIIIW